MTKFTWRQPCRESTGYWCIPHTENQQHWTLMFSLLLAYSEKAVEQMVKLQVIWYTMMFIPHQYNFYDQIYMEATAKCGAADYIKVGTGFINSFNDLLSTEHTGESFDANFLKISRVHCMQAYSSFKTDYGQKYQNYWLKNICLKSVSWIYDKWNRSNYKYVKLKKKDECDCTDIP